MEEDTGKVWGICQSDDVETLGCLLDRSEIKMKNVTLISNENYMIIKPSITKELHIFLI